MGVHLNLLPILAEDDDFMKKQNGNQTDLKISPRPLGTTIFEEIETRIRV